jgi:hypothetical protein
MIIHSPIVSGSLTFANGATITLPQGSVYSGSFSGSYQGASFTGGTFSGNGSGLTFGGTGIISGSSQLTTDFDARYLNTGGDGIVSSSAQVTSLLPIGTISGSSQVDGTAITNKSITIAGTSTSLGGSITLATITNGSGIVSGSSQINADSITNFDSNVLAYNNSLGVISGSTQVNADTITNFDLNVLAYNNSLGVVSGSSQIDVTATTNYSTISSHISNTSNPHSVTATQVGLGNVTNESKATMFTNAELTGTPTAPTATANTNSTQIATTAYVQQELTDLIGGASAAFDTLLEISASLASGDSTLTTLVDGKLSKASNLSDLTDVSAARTNLGLAIGTNVQAYNSTLAAVAGGTYSGDDSITTIGTVTAGSVTAILPSGTISGSSQVVLSSTTGGGTSANVQFGSLGIGMAASGTSGRIDATNDIVAYSSSDRRFKDNIKPIESPLNKITKIGGYTYDWKEENKIEHGYEGNDVGVIAQEIEEVLPQLVQTRESGYKAVKYDKLVALLIEGIKEQQSQIEELTNRINKLENGL